MAYFDSEQVRKIWQRVQSGSAYEPTAVPTDQAHTGLHLRDLIAREMTKKAMLLQLSGRFHGKNAAILRQMAMQAQSHAAILRGICAMTEGNAPIIQNPPSPAASTAVLLRRCYGQSLQSLSEYAQKKSDPQFGSTYQKMAEQEKAHCRTLLTLLGNLPALKQS